MSVYTTASGWCEPAGGIRYRVTRTLWWAVGFSGSGLWVRVPAGRTFDVSVPVALRWAFDPHDPRYLKAAALHDCLLGLGWNRLSAGAEFHQALRADRVPRLTRFAMWFAVSLYRYE